MAVERSSTGFERVSRLKGTLFKYLTFGASIVGIVALAILLVYVAIDAFDLTNASPAWLFTYYATVVCPLVGFCLYSAGDRELMRRTLLVLGGGLVATALSFVLVETFVRPIPRLTWPVAYLFAVVVPVTGYVAFVASRHPIGRTGFGLVGRLLGGTALGLALIVLFTVFDERLWFLAYTLGVLPAVGALAYARANPSSPVSVLPVPVALVGFGAATVLRDIVAVYPTTWLLYVWTLAVPAAAIVAGISAGRDGDTGRRPAIAGGAALALIAGGSLAAGQLGVSPEHALPVLLGAGVPTVTFGRDVLESGSGRIGLLLPAVLVGGALVGALAVESVAVPAPDPWIDASFLTSSPSRFPERAGLYPAIVGSVLVIAVVAVLSLVLGVGTAVFLEEYTVESGVTGAITRLIQVNVANLAAVPSVVYGLLGLGLFANLLGLGFGSVVTASLTLSLLILPITVISAQEAIRAVPDDLRRGSYAMGATKWQTTKHVVLPEALPGIFTGTILALGRAIGETAPLIMIGAAHTVFSPPSDVWSKISAMPMQIFVWSDFPQAEFRYGVLAAGVVTLLCVLLGMNAAAIILRNKYESGV